MAGGTRPPEGDGFRREAGQERRFGGRIRPPRDFSRQARLPGDTGEPEGDDRRRDTGQGRISDCQSIRPRRIPRHMRTGTAQGRFARCWGFSLGAFHDMHGSGHSKGDSPKPESVPLGAFRDVCILQVERNRPRGTVFAAEHPKGDVSGAESVSSGGFHDTPAWRTTRNTPRETLLAVKQLKGVFPRRSSFVFRAADDIFRLAEGYEHLSIRDLLQQDPSQGISLLELFAGGGSPALP